MADTPMYINRKGITTEYKRGHIYLTHTEWEDGHCEIEIHKCVPEQLFHSCDQHQLTRAKEIFNKLADNDFTPMRLEIIESEN